VAVGAEDDACGDRQTTPPRIWLVAVLVFRIRPAATALTTRVTRMTPSCSSTFTSAKIAECALFFRESGQCCAESKNPPEWPAGGNPKPFF
jgi:hypothetical protein